MTDKIYMLNALWFKQDGGEARYHEYIKAIEPLVSAAGGRKLRSLVPTRGLIGDFDADLMFFVEYPDWDAFKKFANSADYHQVAHMREEAIEKSLLIRCDRPERSYR